MKRFSLASLISALVLMPLTNATAVVQSEPVPAPAVDHHTHIWSLRAAQVTADPLLPPVQVPDEFARLLNDRQELLKTRDPEVLARLYTEDVVVLQPVAPIWLKGSDAVEFLAQSVGGLANFPMTPMAFGQTSDAGYIAGTYTVDAGDRMHHLSNFLLVLERDEDGEWRIAAETLTTTGPPSPKEVSASQLIKELDEAGVRRAVVLSVAYWFSGPRSERADGSEHENVRAENDWVAEQAGQYADRLVPFFSVNPLKDYAIEEIERCARDGRFRGLKLHLGNSGVDVRNPEHANKLRAVFEAANRYELPIVVHLWTADADYGRGHSEALLNDVLPGAPDIVVQIAHMAASGPGYHSDEAFEVFVEAAEADDPRMRNVYTDVSSMVTRDMSPPALELVARRLRQFGLERVLFGSDRAGELNDPPGDAWSAFLRLPLTADEFRAIAENTAPYLK